MILSFADHDGDPVALDSALIVGISIGAINGPRTAGADVTVTLVWVAGAAQPFMVAQSFAEVLDAWKAARQTAPATATQTAAYPGLLGWQHQYDPTAPPAWAATRREARDGVS